MDGLSYFPLFMNLAHKRFFVFGAGSIAARRITKMIRYGADVVVIAPQIHMRIKQLCAMYPKQLILHQRTYQKGELRAEEADYVLAATDDLAVNTQIASECRKKRIPVNHASDRRQCDFYFPALVEQEHFLLGVISTDGDHRSVAKVSARLRQKDLDTDDKDKEESKNIRLAGEKE